MSIELPKAYDFKSTEQRIYDWWEKNGFFSPSNDPKKPGFDPGIKPYVISIPPANVTGELHLGHAMFVTMEDLMIRHARMKGIPALWVPGTDHAGIATQLMVEQHLLSIEEVTREELGREEFLKRTWEWKEKYGGIITSQIRRLGASCDWSRERFTLDEGLSRAVREAFVRLYEKGLIYRGKRLVNWAPLLKTAVSDLEVEYSEEPGFLYYFKYVLVDDPNEFIPVATTRPETILGDTAVAVHPEDDRFKKYVGRKVRVPILNREIPVIADDYVDREFGTGALKITPGHDPNDYAIGERHQLEIIPVLDKNAHVNENGGPYKGMDRFECRKKIWADMKAVGLVIKEQPYTLNVPRSQRGGEIVEPMISTQWFIKIKPLADAALEVVRDGRIKIVPERFTKVYYNWLENIQDWCISRQLWWGHRIPVWYCQDCGEMTTGREDPTECAHCKSHNIQQDPDVLDTWFSSGLWPFSTLGWPDETPDLKYFYPTSTMETGYDILFFWVARMIMFSLEFTGKIPFDTVYLHGLIRDEHGQKMSKSKGNVIDPLILMNEMGTDALRFSVLVGSTPGNDMNLGVKKVEANRNFANKIWNAGRFIISTLKDIPEDGTINIGEIKPNNGGEQTWTRFDLYIWASLQQLIRDVNRLFKIHHYGEAGRQIYEFFWNKFADWYIEASKEQMKGKAERKIRTAHILSRILDTSLRLLHPFTPFVTEEIWGYLKREMEKHTAVYKPVEGWAQGLIVSQWPNQCKKQEWEDEYLEEFSLVSGSITALRNIKAKNNYLPKNITNAQINPGVKMDEFASQAGTIAFLTGINPQILEISANYIPQDYSSDVYMGVQVGLKAEIPVDSDSEKQRIEAELQNIKSQITRLEKLLASDFARKAPSPLVEKEREKLTAYKESAKKLKSQLR